MTVLLFLWILHILFLLFKSILLIRCFIKWFWQGEFSSGFLPLSLKQYHYIDRVFTDGVDSPQSGILRSCWKEVAQIIAPVLLQGSSEVSYRLGLLVSGAVGKTTSIIHAARFLGLKHLIIDCLDLQVMFSDGQLVGEWCEFRITLWEKCTSSWKLSKMEFQDLRLVFSF